MKIEGVGGIAVALTLAGCAHGENRVQIQTVKVPVPVACVSDSFPATPSYPDTDDALRAAVDAAERYRLIAVGRLLRDARLGELEPAVAACRKIGN